jgi:acyl carrier protein
MSDQEDRLMQCFASVFPMSTPEEIVSAGPEWFAGSDSLALVTLAAVIQEEFGVAIDTLVLAELNSFRSVLDYLRRHTSTTY